MLMTSLAELGRVVLVGGLAYLGLIALLRVSGKRTLSKMNAFDFIVTVALGSTLATVLLSAEVAWLEGMAAFALLIGAQYVLTWLSVRVPWMQTAIKGEPALLLHEGRMLPHALRRERVTEAEIVASLRQAGLARIDHAGAVILETDGTLSVLPRHDAPASTLANVRTPGGGSV